jgi:hypothetical protein
MGIRSVNHDDAVIIRLRIGTERVISLMPRPNKALYRRAISEFGANIRLNRKGSEEVFVKGLGGFLFELSDTLRGLDGEARDIFG